MEPLNSGVRRSRAVIACPAINAQCKFCSDSYLALCRSPAPPGAAAAPACFWPPGATSAAPWTAPPAACSPTASFASAWGAGQAPRHRPAGRAGTMLPLLRPLLAGMAAVLLRSSRVAARAAALSGGNPAARKRSSRTCRKTNETLGSGGGRPLQLSFTPTQLAALTTGQTTPSVMNSVAAR